MRAAWCEIGSQVWQGSETRDRLGMVQKAESVRDGAEIRSRNGFGAARSLQERTAEMEQIIETHSAEETYALGKKIGESAKPGQVYSLIGDLGVGKTVFTQGLAAGLGITDSVNSPTFTILQIYEDGRIPFYHFDVYRIGDVEEMEEIGYEDCFYGEGVCLIEWANLIEEILPENYIRIEIAKNLMSGFNYRTIRIEQR